MWDEIRSITGCNSLAVAALCSQTPEQELALPGPSNDQVTGIMEGRRDASVPSAEQQHQDWGAGHTRHGIVEARNIALG